MLDKSFIESDDKPAQQDWPPEKLERFSKMLEKTHDQDTVYLTRNIVAQAFDYVDALGDPRLTELRDAMHKALAVPKIVPMLEKTQVEMLREEKRRFIDYELTRNVFDNFYEKDRAKEKLQAGWDAAIKAVQALAATAAPADGRNELTEEEINALDRFKGMPQLDGVGIQKMRGIIALEHARSIRLGAKIENLQDEICALQGKLAEATAAPAMPGDKPGFWHEWAMQEAKKFAHRFGLLNHEQNALHCLLIEAMKFATPTQPADPVAWRMVTKDEGNVIFLTDPAEAQRFINQGAEVKALVETSVGAQPVAPAEETGFAIVPLVPTQEMLDNGAAFSKATDGDLSVIYRAMLVTRPTSLQPVAPEVPKPGPWNDWAGGKCPVAGEVLVDLKMTNGEILLSKQAQGFHWDRWEYRDDIIAWRYAVAAPTQPALLPSLTEVAPMQTVAPAELKPILDVGSFMDALTDAFEAAKKHAPSQQREDSDTSLLDFLQSTQQTPYRHFDEVMRPLTDGSYQKEQVFLGWTVDSSPFNGEPVPTIREAIRAAMAAEKEPT